MWKESGIGLIGRDTVLQNRILPRVNAKKSFILSGEPGIGKSAILLWAFEHTNALCGEITVPFFERLAEIDKATAANGNTTCGLIWGGKGLGKSNLVHWLSKRKLDAGESVYIFDPKKSGMNVWDSRAVVVGNNSDYAAIESALKALESSMRNDTVKFTIFIDEANVLKNHIKGFSEMWLPFAQEGRQYEKSVWIIGQSKTAESLGIKGKYDLTKCFDVFAEMCWDKKKDRRYITIEGSKDSYAEKLVQPIKYDGSDNPHPIVIDRTLPKKAFVSGNVSYGNVIKSIAEQWGLSTDKMVINDVVRLVMQQAAGNFIFVDDLQKLDVKSINLLKAISDNVHLYGAMRDDRHKEDLKQLLWGFEVIKITHLSKADNLRLAGLAAVRWGCTVPKDQIANASHGVPGRIHSFCTTGEIPREDSRMRSEEFDLAPVFLLCIFFLVLLRFVGRATDATDLVLIGGASMVLMVVGRGVLSKASSK